MRSDDKPDSALEPTAPLGEEPAHQASSVYAARQSDRQIP
jgi:hypothetical protein